MKALRFILSLLLILAISAPAYGASNIHKRVNAPGYEIDSIGSIKSKVIIGGHTDSNGQEVSPNEFEPSMHNVFHNGDSFITIHHIDSGKTGRTDTLVKGVIKHEVNGFKHEIYEGEGDTLKWDMVFDSVPVASSLSFRIRHSKNLVFYKQVLTQTDINNGSAYSVPEAKGSYAIYYKDGRKDNQWQTGKVAHIYSPYFIDAIGAKSPVLNSTLIEVEPGIKRLVVDLPMLWLNGPQRVYPVRLDPIVGYNSKGALSFSFGGNNADYHRPYESPANATITGLHIYPVETGRLFKMAVYETTGVNHVSFNQALVASGAEKSSVGGVDNSLLVTSLKDIVLGDWYKTGFIIKTGMGVYYDSGGSSYQNELDSITYANEPSDPCVVGTQNTLDWLISTWFEYTVPSAGPTRTHLGYPQMVF
jgi:hypothetical protein